jgi:eukaryotic-like serine/threonine-protein kinase
MMGTVAYMSPEQVRGEVLDNRTDIFSFAIVLYEMATGHQAFPGHTSGVVTEAILNRAPAPLRRLFSHDGLELDRIVTKGLQKDRKLRYQTAADLRADLLTYKDNVIAGRSASMSLTSRIPALPKRWAFSVAEIVEFCHCRPDRATHPSAVLSSSCGPQVSSRAYTFCRILSVFSFYF